MRRVVPCIEFGKDSSAQATHGTVQPPIFSRSQSPFKVGEVRAAADEAVRQYTREDLLVMEGPPILCWAALNAWLKAHGTAIVLLYHSRERSYIEREVFSKTGGESC